MKVLFDQGTPVPLRKHLSQHDVATAFECGWSNLANGDLLAQVESNGFEVLVTTDQNLAYQQNLAGRVIGIVVLGSTSWPRIQKALPAVVNTIDNAAPNDYSKVAIPPGR